MPDKKDPQSLSRGGAYYLVETRFLLGVALDLSVDNKTSLSKKILPAKQK